MTVSRTAIGAIGSVVSGADAGTCSVAKIWLANGPGFIAVTWAFYYPHAVRPQEPLEILPGHIDTGFLHRFKENLDLFSQVRALSVAHTVHTH